MKTYVDFTHPRFFLQRKLVFVSYTIEEKVWAKWMCNISNVIYM
jgi:hypothetical protein